MSKTITTTIARTATEALSSVEHRADAEAAITGGFRPRLQRELDAVAIAGASYRQAEAECEGAYADVIRLCGSDKERKEIEDRARNSVPLPDELKDVRRPGKYITRMLVIESDGKVMQDGAWTEPPLVNWNSSHDIELVIDSGELKGKPMDALLTWFQAKSNAWDSFYNDEQKAAYEVFRTAQRAKTVQEQALTRAVGRLMRVPANTLEEIAAKVRAWADGWGILKPGGKLATGQMADFDNEMVLAIIGEDLLRGASRPVR